MKLFIAKFDQLDSKRSPQDVNGNHPLIADVISGEANAFVMNGTLFHDGGFKHQTLYLCVNYTDIFSRPQIKPLTKVNVLELKELMTSFGEPVYSLDKLNEEIRLFQKDCIHVGDDSHEYCEKVCE